MTLEETREVLKQIEGGTHWVTRLIPSSTENRFTSVLECFNAASRSAVELRGWDYPHIQPREDRRYGRSRPLNNGWELWVNFMVHREVWRLMQSGQFIHFASIWEDDRSLDQYRQSPTDLILLFENVVYTITEIVEFASRLTTTTSYEPTIQLEIDLRKASGRRLVASPTRWLSGDYRCELETITLRRTLAISDLQSTTHDISNGLIVDFLGRFGFDANPRVIGDLQQALLERRLYG